MPFVRHTQKEKFIWYFGFVFLGIFLGPIIFPPTGDGGLLVSLILGSTLGTLPIGLIELGVRGNNSSERARMRDELLEDKYEQMKQRRQGK